MSNRKRSKERVKGRHPERPEIIRAIARGQVPFRSHLNACRDCRELYELLVTFRTARDVQLIEPSDRAISNQTGIPLIIESRSPARVINGRVAFDSWADFAAAQIRDAAVGSERRVRFTAGPVTLEFVAERQPEGWEYTARVYRGGRATSDFVLKVGRRTLLPAVHLCYNWSSPRPPQTIRLLSPSVRIDLEKLDWRSSRP